MNITRKLPMLAPAFCLAALVSCSPPPPAGESGGASGAATGATPAVPETVSVLYQPTQLCPHPKACRQGDELIWVPSGTSLGVSRLHVEELPRSTVYWYEVEYDGRTGWITEMATDKAPQVRGGKIVRE